MCVCVGGRILKYLRNIIGWLVYCVLGSTHHSHHAEQRRHYKSSIIAVDMRHEKSSSVKWKDCMFNGQRTFLCVTQLSFLFKWVLLHIGCIGHSEASGLLLISHERVLVVEKHWLFISWCQSIKDWRPEDSFLEYSSSMIPHFQVYIYLYSVEKKKMDRTNSRNYVTDTTLHVITL